MDAAGNVGAAAQYFGLIVNEGLEGTLRQAELQIRLKDKTDYLNVMANIYGFDPASMKELVTLGGGEDTGLGDVIDLVVNSAGDLAQPVIDAVTSAFQGMVDALSINQEDILVPIMWYSNPAATNAIATVPESCVSFEDVSKASSSSCPSAGAALTKLPDNLFMELMKVEIPEQTLADVTGPDAAPPVEEASQRIGCGRCQYLSNSGSCKSCPPSTYQAHNDNMGGIGSCKRLQCWADEDTEPSLAMVQARLPCALPAEDAAAASKKIKMIAAQQGANVIKKMFNKLSVSFGSEAAKFNFAYQFPATIEASWTPELGSVGETLKALSLLFPAISIRMNSLAGVPLLASSPSKHNGMAEGLAEFRANFALHQFGGGLGVVAEATRLKDVLAKSTRSIDLTMHWADIDEIIEELATRSVMPDRRGTCRLTEQFWQQFGITGTKNPLMYWTETAMVSSAATNFTV